MSEENKNPYPEEDKNKNTNDDDFGLPDFEFEALDDDDDEIEEETAVPSSSSDIGEETPDPETEAVPSMDVDDLEDLDLDGLDDLGDLDLGDLDLGDIDLAADIDTSEVSDELADIDSAIEETSLPESTEENTSTDDGLEMPTEELEEDGMFYEEETFDDYGIFDNKQEVEQEYVGDFAGESSVPVEEVSDEEIGKSKGQFAKIVFFGIVLFVAIGVAFMYWSDFFDSGGGEDGKEVAQKEAKKEKEVKKTKPNKAKAASKITSEKPKAKPAPVSSEGVTMYTARVNRRHLVAGSFATEEKAKIYAQQLVAQGESSAVIPPFGSSGSYRVTITSFATQREALSNLDSYRANFGSTIWVLRY